MIFGICMVRDGGDIIGATVRHMLTQVDRVIVADNLSTDNTRDVLDSIGSDRLTVIDDNDPAHRQGTKTTAMALRARSLGASWVVPFDCDEIWYSPFGRIADVLSALDGCWVATATLFDHIVTGADDPTDPDPTTRIGWRRLKPGPFPKVACRAADDIQIHEGNHGVSYATDASEQAMHGLLAIRHFPYRSAEQMWSKAHTGAAALRAATEVNEVTGQHWRDYDALGPDGVRDAFMTHFYAEHPESRPDLVFDPAPCG